MARWAWVAVVCAACGSMPAGPGVGGGGAAGGMSAGGGSAGGGSPAGGGSASGGGTANCDGGFSFAPELQQPGSGLGVTQVLSDGQRFLLVWKAGGAAFARHFGADGQWIDAQPIALQADTDRVAFGGGRYTVVGSHLGMPTYGIVGYQVDPSGAVQAGPFTVASGAQGSPDGLGGVAFGSTRWLVVYGQGRSIYSRTISMTGSVGGENPLPAPDGYANGVQVAGGADGGFLAAWVDYRDLSNAGSIYGAFVSNGGSAGSAFGIHVIATDTMACSSVFPVAGGGSYLVFFQCSDGTWVSTLDGPAKGTSFGSHPDPAWDGAHFGILQNGALTRFDTQANQLDSTPLWPGSGNTARLASDGRGHWASAMASSAGITVKVLSSCQ